MLRGSLTGRTVYYRTSLKLKRLLNNRSRTSEKKQKNQKKDCNKLSVLDLLEQLYYLPMWHFSVVAQRIQRTRARNERKGPVEPPVIVIILSVDNISMTLEEVHRQQISQREKGRQEKGREIKDTKVKYKGWLKEVADSIFVKHKRCKQYRRIFGWPNISSCLKRYRRIFPDDPMLLLSWHWSRVKNKKVSSLPYTRETTTEKTLIHNKIIIPLQNEQQNSFSFFMPSSFTTLPPQNIEHMLYNLENYNLKEILFSVWELSHSEKYKISTHLPTCKQTQAFFHCS